MKKDIWFFTFVLAGLLVFPVSAQERFPKDFSFVFMTDVHIRPDTPVLRKFSEAVQAINRLEVDFVISGGDQVFDVMRGNVPKSDTLFSLFQEYASKINVPVYKTVGNHELFGIYPESDVDSTHRDYKYGMFERYFGKTYYSFDHKGCHFIILNVLDVHGQRYIGQVGEEQLAWLRADLAQVDPRTPVVVTVHVPLVSVMGQIYPKPGQSGDAPAVLDRDEVLAAFSGHNLKLVLQGHLHWREELYVENRTHFITGGAIAGRPSWRGTNHGPRGFYLFHFRNGVFSWEFVELKA